MSPSTDNTCLPIALAACAVFVLPMAVDADDLPTRGMYVPELQIFDDTMQDFMAARGIQSGLLGIMRDGCVVYERGFGWRDASHTEELPEDAMMRIASCGKPITAAAIHKLAAMGTISLDDFVFDLGQDDPGILDYAPWPTLRDGRVADITVQNLLDHQSGWDPSGDPTYAEVAIAQLMGVFSPPGRILTARYIMGMELQVDPGTPDCNDAGEPDGCYPGRQYSNAGYMMLGLIIEQESGMDYMDFVWEHVFGAIPGEPGTSVEQGRTFLNDQNPREPWYVHNSYATNVFDPFGPPVREPYGGWDHEARIAQGGIIAATEPLLKFLEYYTMHGEPISGLPQSSFHSGSLKSGTRSLVRKRADGINYVVLFNRRETSGESWSDQIMDELDDVITNFGVVWPMRCIDGIWVDFNHPFYGAGNFDDPFNKVDAGLANTPDQARMRIKGSSTNWAGTISQRVELHAPLGSAVIGQ